MSRKIIFIAPATGRKVNPIHFLGYMPGGIGGGVDPYSFPDFGRHAQFETAECLPVVLKKSAWDTDWAMAGQHELNQRAEMHKIIQFLEHHPLSREEYERLSDLASTAPLKRKKVDDRLEKLGLVEEYDPGCELDAVECTQLFYTQAFGQYANITYDGQLMLPYINIHGELCHTSQLNREAEEAHSLDLEPYSHDAALLQDAREVAELYQQAE
jgi:hypothetical protein